MAINFPNNPNPNDTHSSGGKTWLWDRTSWKLNSTAAAGMALTDLSVTTTSTGTAALSYNNTNGVFTYTPPDLGANTYSLPTASTTVLGGVKIDGSTITINNGVISGASGYNNGDLDARLNTATATSGQILSWTGSDYDWVAESVPTSITVANESTDTTCYPLFSTNTTGNIAPKTVTSFKLNSQTGEVEAGSFKKTGGTSSEFLKADGSIDSTSYSSITSGSMLQTTFELRERYDGTAIGGHTGNKAYWMKIGNQVRIWGYITTGAGPSSNTNIVALAFNDSNLPTIAGTATVSQPYFKLAGDIKFNAQGSYSNVVGAYAKLQSTTYHEFYLFLETRNTSNENLQMTSALKIQDIDTCQFGFDLWYETS